MVQGGSRRAREINSLQAIFGTERGLNYNRCLKIVQSMDTEQKSAGQEMNENTLKTNFVVSSPVMTVGTKCTPAGLNGDRTDAL